MSTFVAVDLGATSGRVVNVTLDVDKGSLELDVVRRFPTTTRPGQGGTLAWDIDAIVAELRRGLVEAVGRARVESMAIDSWAVDYGLLDAAGQQVGPVHAYRSSRTDGVMAEVTAELGRERIYGTTGIQFLPFNTIYQLAAARGTDDYEAADLLLMVPDLLNHALCGSTTNDVTNASTTQLLDVGSRAWSDDLVKRVGLRREIMPALHEPGDLLGAARGVGRMVDGLPVVAAASHDTASAVAGTPLGQNGTDIYISCGTWALVGCELSHAVTTPDAMAANVTNELGVEGSVRLLKNVTGLWLLEESRRWWANRGLEIDMVKLVAAAELVPGGRAIIDPDDPRFAAPGDIPVRIRDVCAATGQIVPSRPIEVARVILDSLAVAWRLTVETIERVSGRSADTIHLVGGGSAIPLLRRLGASACERPLVAGPVEATVVGNAIVQAVAAGVLPDVAAGRVLLDRDRPLTEIKPEALLEWDELSTRLLAVRDWSSSPPPPPTS